MLESSPRLSAADYSLFTEQFACSQRPHLPHHFSESKEDRPLRQSTWRSAERLSVSRIAQLAIFVFAQQQHFKVAGPVVSYQFAQHHADNAFQQSCVLDSRVPSLPRELASLFESARQLRHYRWRTHWGCLVWIPIPRTEWVHETAYPWLHQWTLGRTTSFEPWGWRIPFEAHFWTQLALNFDLKLLAWLCFEEQRKRIDQETIDSCGQTTRLV